MKKLIILLTAVAICAGAAFAQSNDSIERLKQQEALLKQQQKEQQDLLKEQQKEQERQQKEQQKEQEKLQKEQQKAAQAELKREQERQKREEVKAANKARAEQEKAEKEAKRKARRDAIGRNARISIDPEVSLLGSFSFVNNSNLYNSNGFGIGLSAAYHYPLNKRCDIIVGLGYQFRSNSFLNTVKVADDLCGFDTLKTDNPYMNKSTLFSHTIQLPILFSFYDKKDKSETYIGIRPGYSLGNSFFFGQYDKDGKMGTSHDASNLGFTSKFRLDLMWGWASKWLIFSPGGYVYFNLLPAYTAEGIGIHEFGVAINL